MKKQTLVLMAAVVALTGSALAQPGRMPGGSGFNAIMTKLFGDTRQFSADIEVQANAGPQGEVTMPGRMYFDGGKTRLEINLSDAKGSQMNPAMMQQMKTMGMDQTIVITRPDTKLNYVVYPGLTAYAESPLKDEDLEKPDSAFKIDKTKLGDETVDGHPTVKNKMVITDDQNEKHKMTVWNATDMKDFPLKIQSNENARDTLLTFKNVKKSKPDASLFEPPASYKKYTNPREMMQQEMMKRLGAQNMTPGGGAAPSNHP